MIVSAFLTMITACESHEGARVDWLNDVAYDYHYRNLDSTLFYARWAENEAGRYDGGRAEAYNHLAFVSTARMQYDLAAQQLDSVRAITDNQVELLIADIQHMRLCQRQSHNKDFYTYRESALRKLKRIGEEYGQLSEHLKKRMVYARSEMSIITSTYYYYVGLEQQSVEAIEEISPYGEIVNDTAQLLNYLYNVGAGGIITQGTQEDINQKEMEYLFRCYNLAVEGDYPFWVANSMQAMSEHLQVPELRQKLIDDNYPTIRKVNVDSMPDDLLAGNLALRSLDVFQKYGDVYQTAGSYRTLAQCYWYIGDYESSLSCLNMALTNDSAIFRAPDLVASIQEQLSVDYAALNDKANSHLNRNLYLDTQDKTRQDLYLESRAEQLNQSVRKLNAMTVAIVAVMLLGVIMLFLFAYLRKRNSSKNTLDSLLVPLQQWKRDNEAYVSQLNDKYEETTEEMAVANLHVVNHKKLYLEQRAKVSLVNMVTPYIDRMLHEINKLTTVEENPQLREERYLYLAELTDQIIDYNEILTQWIQLRRGELSLHIESFPLQGLFDIVEQSKRAFQLKKLQLNVIPSSQWVKADRTLTLFMVNTMADNARKNTPEGGTVTVEAQEFDKYIEISITDTGIGMSEQQVAQAFSLEKKAFADEALADHTKTNAAGYATKEGGHGFGLVNCKGIIEKYKKISSLFNICSIGVESQKGKGSRFYFRLPKGVRRALIAIVAYLNIGQILAANVTDSLMQVASNFTDSVYQCNVNDQSEMAVRYAEKALHAINKTYLSVVPGGVDTLVMQSSKSVLQNEILWFHDQLPIDYHVILKLRNELAVAALALHEWTTYRYNNKVYTQLYKEMSADATLADYCSVMKKTETNMYMAVVILIILSLLILLAYFLLYYRHQVYYRFCLERVRAMNNVLTSEMDSTRKLNEIQRLAGKEDLKNGQVEKHKRAAYEEEPLPEPLQEIADQLITTLKASMDANKRRLEDIDLAQDEVRKCQFEIDKLHVCNSVLDNCLSTLKHETMYYPSRIKTLIGTGDSQLQGISELAGYYKQLYTLLSAQAMKQVESVKLNCSPIVVADLLPQVANQPLANATILGDRQMLTYLFDILKKQAGTNHMTFSLEEKGDRYLVIRATIANLKLSDEECMELFNPHINNMPWLLCRQIVRDVGETTNARACGIMAHPKDNATEIVITIVRAKGGILSHVS
jgi:signal transduction histidine kinase